jgi:hypothetical protein
MIEKTAYTITPVVPNELVNIDKQFKAFELFGQFDSLLRKELGLELNIIDLDSYVLDECQKLIRSQGVSSIMSIVHVQESLMAKARDYRHKYLIVDMLRDKLTSLTPSDEVVIVDNYIFPTEGLSTPDKKDYLNMFENIFSLTVEKVKTIKFVTMPDYSKSLFDDFTDLLLLLNPQISISCKTTRDFHDRFWIVDRSKGLFVGTSINGIGKKYALVDVIRNNDIIEIVNLLESMKLI